MFENSGKHRAVGDEGMRKPSILALSLCWSEINRDWVPKFSLCLISQSPREVGTFFSPILQMRESRPREASHRASHSA